MIQQEGGQYLGCRCPACLYSCDACMGTDSVLSRTEMAAGSSRLQALAELAAEDTERMSADEEQPEEGEEAPWTDRSWSV